MECWLVRAFLTFTSTSCPGGLETLLTMMTCSESSSLTTNKPLVGGQNNKWWRKPHFSEMLLKLLVSSCDAVMTFKLGLIFSCDESTVNYELLFVFIIFQIKKNSISGVSMGFESCRSKARFTHYNSWSQ